MNIYNVMFKLQWLQPLFMFITHQYLNLKSNFSILFYIDPIWCNWSIRLYIGVSITYNRLVNDIYCIWNVTGISNLTSRNWWKLFWTCFTHIGLQKSPGLTILMVATCVLQIRRYIIWINLNMAIKVAQWELEFWGHIQNLLKFESRWYTDSYM